jgi:rubrerythrin
MVTMIIGEMLDRAAEFERRLEAYYADLRDRATRDGPRLLVYYLARHRRDLPEALDSFTAEQIEHIRSARMKYDDTDFSPRKCFEDWELASDVTGRGLLDMAIVFVEELIRFYRWMAQQPLGELPGDLFQSLLKIEERHVVELKKIRAMDYF